MHYDLGDKKLFGDAFAVYPSLDIRVLKKNKLFDSYIQFGWGLAYLTRHYDQFTNPINNAVGSALNNVTDLKVRFEKRLSTHWSAQMGFSFTHFSNGTARLPNYGFNIPALNLGTKWTPNPLNTEGYIHRDSSSKANKKWGINVFSGLGLSASSSPSSRLRLNQNFFESNNCFAVFIKMKKENRRRWTFQKLVPEDRPILTLRGDGNKKLLGGLKPVGDPFLSGCVMM